MNNTTSILHLSNHGDPNLICRSAKWYDILVFYFGNYIAHAATTKSQSGQSLLGTILTITLALLFPTSGIIAGLKSIFALPMFAATELRTAARAGALCMVVKYPKRPRVSNGIVEDEGEELLGEIGGQVNDGGETGAGVVSEWPRDQDTDRVRNGRIRLMATKIHSRCVLPDNYTLLVIPEDAEFEDDPVVDISAWRKTIQAVTSLFQKDAQLNTTISNNYSFVKILVSVGQTIFASTTVYRTRGDQISQYGYAAFGLTVAPYAWMSLINGLGHLLCPEYPAMYLVESASLDQLRAELASNGTAADFPIGSTVGKITSTTEQKAMRKLHKQYEKPFSENLRNEMSNFGLCVGAVPLAVYWGLSSFHQGSSTTSQQLWTMLWLVFGFGVGAFIGPVSGIIEGRPLINSAPMITYPREFPTRRHEMIHGVSSVMFLLIYAAPAIRGFVVVGQMIYSYGVCFRID